MCVCPTTDHIYWYCSYLEHMRQLSRSINESTARLGWNAKLNYPLVRQAATIRQMFAMHNRKNTPKSGLDEGGPGGRLRMC